MKVQSNSNTKAILRKMNKLEALTLLYFRLTRKLHESTTAWCGQQGQTNQHNRKSSERTTHTYSHDIFNKGPKPIQWRKESLFNLE